MIYSYKEKDYEIIEKSKIKIGKIWIDVIIYKCLYNNPDGLIWVRESTEFFELFKPKITYKKHSKTCRCGGTGWLWGHELETPLQENSDNRYLCDVLQDGDEIK